MGSQAFSISKEQIIKWLKGLGYALAGAALLYVEQYISSHDFGAYAPIVTALNSALVYFGKLYIPNNSIGETGGESPTSKVG